MNRREGRQHSIESQKSLSRVKEEEKIQISAFKFLFSSILYLKIPPADAILNESVNLVFFS